jgi:hypothetical protein
VARNLGNATFAPRELVYQAATGVTLSSLVADDFDGDLDTDLVVYRSSNPGGGGINVEFADLLRNDGTGAFTYVPGTLQFQDAIGMLSADFDGDGDPDLLVMNWGTVHFLQNNGTGTFAKVDSSMAALAAPYEAAVGDIDGDLDVDIVWGGAAGMFTLQNDGTGHFTILAPYGPGIPLQLVDLDGDGDRDLVTLTYSGAYQFGVSLNGGSGDFGPQTIIPGFSTPSLQPDDLALHDLDADGDVDLVVASTAAPRLTVLQNLGNATFTVLGDIATDTVNPLRGAVIADLDADGDLDLALSEWGPAPGVRRYRACRTAGAPLCLGDGSGTACPCGNNSAASAQAGCLNSLGSPGALRGAGIARLANDTLVLSGSGLPNSTALYIQGTTAAAGGSGILLGDGLRCAGGSLVRLGARTSVGGGSVFPGPSGPSLSVLGLVSTPGERIYQIWYRDPTNFCTPEGSNLTNGLRVLWAP